jgi:curved DNA-binding protein CbpA
VTVDAVRLTYRRLAKQAHPDGGGSAAAFRRLKTDRDLALAAVQNGGA